MSEAAGGSGASSDAPADQAEIIRVFQSMMAQKEQLSSKISELTVEHAEYKRVADTLKPMDGARRCFQLLNGVLVEKTIDEVAPSVAANRDSLESVVKGMHERLAKLLEEMKAYQAKFNCACSVRRARTLYARRACAASAYPRYARCVILRVNCVTCFYSLN